MSIRDLKTLLAIADGGSFAAAARAVHRTQSAVTVQMKILEQALGIQLFDRSKRPPLLTDAGRVFVSKSIEVVRAYELLFQEASGTAIEGRLRLGAVPTAITGPLPRALAALRERYPRLRIEITMGLSADLVERAHKGDIDAAIISEWRERSSGLHWTPFAYEPLVLIAPMDVPDRTAEELVTSMPFIRYTRKAWVGHLIDSFLKMRHLHVDEIMSLDTLEAITTMVHHGLGVSIVPLRHNPGQFTFPVRNLAFSGAAVYRTIGLVQRPENEKSALAEALLLQLKAFWPSIEKPLRQRHKAQEPRRTRTRAQIKKYRT